MNLRLVEWVGAAGGIAGTLLIVLNNAYSGWGFVLYLISNLCWIRFGVPGGRRA